MIPRLVFTATLALLVVVQAGADEPRGGPGGPPPGKGWNKGAAQTPQPPAVAPAPKQSKGAAPAPQPAPKGKLDAQNYAKGPPSQKAKNAPAPQPPDEGIGRQVSAWAKSGIHGRQLAGMIHQLQATRAAAPTSPAPRPKGDRGRPGGPAPTPPPPSPRGKKGGDE